MIKPRQNQLLIVTCTPVIIEAIHHIQLAMPAAQEGDESSVHQARVASRRLREALPVLGARAHGEALDRAEKRVKRITRALGPVRAIDLEEAAELAHA